MLWKCFTQYAIKFGKLSNAHRTGKNGFSFQSLRRGVPKNVKTTTQLCSFHMLPRKCSKPFKLGLNSTLTKNFQMCKLDLGKAEEPEIKLPTSVGSKEIENPRKTPTSASLTTLKMLNVDHNKPWKIIKQMGISDRFTCLLRNLYTRQELTVRTEHDKKGTGSKLGNNTSRLYVVTLLI